MIQARTIPKRRRIDTSGLPLAKPAPRRRTKGREHRQEAAVVKAVRPKVMERDAPCRLVRRFPTYTLHHGGIAGTCGGPTEWAHLRGWRKSQTMRMAPERRHTTGRTAGLCRRHHGMEERGEIRGTYLTPEEADGQMEWKTPRGVFREPAL